MPLPLDRIGIGPRSHAAALWWAFVLYRQPALFYKSIAALSSGGKARALFAIQLHIGPWVLAAGLSWSLLADGSAAVDRLSRDDEVVGYLEAKIDLVINDILFIYLFIIIIIIQYFYFSNFHNDGGGTAKGAIVKIDDAQWLSVGCIGCVAAACSCGVLGLPILLLIAMYQFALAVEKMQSRIENRLHEITRKLSIIWHIGIGCCLALGAVRLPLAPADWAAVAFVLGIAYRIIYIKYDHVDYVILLASVTFASIVIGLSTTYASGALFGVMFGMSLLRVYYQVLAGWMPWVGLPGSWYVRHPVAWDWMCGAPFPGLSRLLVEYYKHDPAAAWREIDRLIDTYPSQRWEAIQAKVVIAIRRIREADELHVAPRILAELPEYDDWHQGQISALRDRVLSIVEIDRQYDNAQYGAVRRELLVNLTATIGVLRDRLEEYSEPIRHEFHGVLSHWMNIVNGRLAASVADDVALPPQVFRAGQPIIRDREAFVQRKSVIGEIERQLLLATGCPGLILYGRRRIGKSTVLRNATGFLPSAVSVAAVSMQNPAASESQVSLLGEIAGAVRACREWGIALPVVGPHSLTSLIRFLAACDRYLAASDGRLLIALDEYELLDTIIGLRDFSTDLLSMFRESIQTHRRITWLFAGSHEIGELTNAEWSSYLVSARTVEVPPFTFEETRLLLTDPMHHSPHWGPGSQKRLPFNDEFWGEGGVDRIHLDAGGWPHLVQLLAETAVSLVVAERAKSVSPKLYERVKQKAIVSGDAVFHQLVVRESRLPGEWEYVARFRKVDSQPKPESDMVYQSLKRRLLVTTSGKEWRLRVPLMQLWLRERG